jgi:peptide-methionine (S)-S-oxide reductase
MSKIETAIFGAGCFWCTEAVFSRLKGVISVTSGYAGGHLKDPNYDQVNSGNTGHAEVLKIEFNPNVINYDTLLDVFFHTHDPTTLNRQGNDVGEQYRSIILYNSDEQKSLAEKKIDSLSESGEFNDPIITQIEPLDKFYPAENYHQDYYQNNQTAPYCQLVIAPKLGKFEKKYQSLIKSAAHKD